MTRFALTLAPIFALALAVASLATATASRAACAAGISKIGGVPAHTFCGPAKATVHLAGKTLSFSGGKCAISQGFWTVNIGTAELGAQHKTKSYFGIALVKPSHADGSYPNVTFAFNVPGKSYLARTTLTLRNGGTKASFAGTMTSGGGHVSGSVTC
jgi:hypothetical protein